MLNKYVNIKNDKIAYRIIDGEVVIIYLKDNTLHILNSVATFIWEHFDDHTQIKDIIKELCEEFDVDYETAEKDSLDLISDLLEKDVIGLEEE